MHCAGGDVCPGEGGCLPRGVYPSMQWGRPLPPVDRQTPVKTKPSQTLFAGGNKTKLARLSQVLGDFTASESESLPGGDPTSRQLKLLQSHSLTTSLSLSVNEPLRSSYTERKRNRTISFKFFPLIVHASHFSGLIKFLTFPGFPVRVGTLTFSHLIPFLLLSFSLSLGVNNPYEWFHKSVFLSFTFNLSHCNLTQNSSTFSCSIHKTVV